MYPSSIPGFFNLSADVKPQLLPLTFSVKSRITVYLCLSQPLLYLSPCHSSFLCWPPAIIIFSNLSETCSLLCARSPHQSLKHILAVSVLLNAGNYMWERGTDTTQDREVVVVVLVVVGAVSSEREFPSVCWGVWKGLNGSAIGLSEVVISPDWRPLGPI